MARIGQMRKRTLTTPHGLVRVSSLWKRDRYWLCLYGPFAALLMLCPASSQQSIERIGAQARWRFAPARQPITSLRDLEEACSQWQRKWLELVQLHEEGASAPQESAAVSLTSAWERLCRRKVDEWAASTRRKNTDYMATWLKLLPATCDIRILTVEDALGARQQARGNRKATTVNDMFAVLLQVLDHAFQEGDLPQRWWQRIKRLPEDRPGSDWWGEHEVRLAKEVVAADAVYRTQMELLLYLGVYLGLRKGEMTNLRWQDLHLDRCHPQTEKPEPICILRCDAEWRPKNGKSRTIPIPTEAAAVLRRHRQKDGYVLQAKKVMPRRKAGEERRDPRHYPYWPDKAWRRLREGVVAKGGKRVRLHDLRHSYASLLLNRNVRAEKVAAWMGHRDTSMIFERYGHLLTYDAEVNALTFDEDPGSVREGSSRIIRFAAHVSA
ncbi:MAG: hypothetical protein EA402_14505 [Planctomycetota bacterium]|nr:MAG: hypothetical protein EA402_14505 [Planctomycetota bacterium]